MENNNFTPPSRGRRTLGVRRTITKSHLTPVSNMKKLNVTQYLKDEHPESPRTPVTGLKTLGYTNISRSSSSYKLSLSRTFTEQHKQKRLIFSAQGSNESAEMDVSSFESSYLRPLPQSPFGNRSLVDTEVDSTALQPIKNYESMNDDELRNEIKRNQKILEDVKRHEQKVNESTEMDVSPLKSSPLRLLPQSPFGNRLLVDTEVDSTALQPIKNYELMNNDELRNEIKRKQKILEDVKRHEQKVNELKELIEVWKNGFRASIGDIKNGFEFKDNNSVFERLQLPKDLIKYL